MHLVPLIVFWPLPSSKVETLSGRWEGIKGRRGGEI